MVCGHSVEIDFTSDMTFYLSTGQVCLLQMLAQENFLAFTKIGGFKSPTSSLHDTEHAPWMTPAVHTGKLTQSHDRHIGTHHSIPSAPTKRPTQLEDSGLGSEDSTLVGGVKVQKLKVKMQEIPIQMVKSSSTKAQKSKAVSKSSSFTAVDTLITAGKVSLFLYSRQKSLCKNNDRSEQEESPRKLETINEQCVELQPFLFVTVMQPAAILSLEHQQQRAQITVYDLTVEGSSVKNSSQGKRFIHKKLCISAFDFTFCFAHTLA